MSLRVTGVDDLRVSCLQVGALLLCADVDASAETSVYRNGLPEAARPATPIGVFRSVRHPTYGEGLQRELEDACAEIGPPELE
jgi:hypothetical protein